MFVLSYTTEADEEDDSGRATYLVLRTFSAWDWALDKVAECIAVGAEYDLVDLEQPSPAGVGL